VSGYGDRNRGRLLGSIWPVRSDGEHQPVAAGAGRMVARRNICVGGRVFDFESANVKKSGCCSRLGSIALWKFLTSGACQPSIQNARKSEIIVKSNKSF